MYLQFVNKLIHLPIDKEARHTTVSCWSWLWKISLESGNNVTVVVIEQSLQSLQEKASFASINHIEKIAQVNWQRVTEAIEAGSTNQGVRSFWLEAKLSLELLLDAKDESEEIYRNIYKLFQQLKHRLKTVKSTINWIEREFPSYSLIEDYERLEVISRFEEDFNSFTNCIVKQYLAEKFFAVREALKSKEEQCNEYLNTLEAISQLPNRLYEQVEVEKNFKINF